MNRECWADYAKAIAITLMCMCHFYLSSEEMRLFIYMFHMPVFYFISGYFDKGKSVSCESVKNNIRKLIIPYMFFSMISIPMGCFVAYHNPEIYGNNELWQQIIKCLLGILIMDDTIKSYAFLPNGPLWFLISLFVARIIFSVFIRLATERKIWMLFVLSLFLIVVYGLHPSCFSIDSACLAIPIYAFGFLSKKVNILKYFDSLKLCYVTVILGLFYLLGIGMKNGNVDSISMIPDLSNAIYSSFVCTSNRSEMASFCVKTAKSCLVQFSIEETFFDFSNEATSFARVFRFE